MMKIHLLQIAFCSLAGILSCAAADDIRTISVNFTSGSDGNYSVSSGPYIEEDVGYGSYAVKGRYWIDFTGINIDQRTGSKPQTLVSLPLKDNRGELDHYAETKLYLCSGGGIWQDNFTPINTGNGRMLHVYMDDQASRGDRSGLKLENLPFSRYTVILYFGGDAKNVPVPAYKINGNYYKSSSEGTLPATGPDDTWGDPCGAGSPNLAKNTLVVSDLTGTLTVETAHTSRGRGRLAGFQVVGILSSGSGAAYTAELVDSVNWSTRQNGFQNESGVWNNGADSIVVITNNCFEPKMLTFDETFRANSFILAGSGTTTLQKNDGVELNVGKYDLSGAGKTVFAYGTGEASVMAGLESVFTAPGNGFLLVGEGKKAVWSNMVWGAAEKISNHGTISVLGGSEEEPLSLTAKDSKVGPYRIGSDSAFKVTANGGNKFYYVSGERAETSTFILDSDVAWGMYPGSSIRNVKARVDGVRPDDDSSNNFWLEESDAFDSTVWLDLNGRDLMLSRSSSFSLGGLSGFGNIQTFRANVNHRIAVSMAFGPTTFSGSLPENVELAVGGTSLLTLIGEGSRGKLSLAEGASVACDVAAQEGQTVKDLKGAGTLFKKGAGTLNLTGNTTSFSGTLSIAEGKVHIAGDASNIGTVLTGRAVQLEFVKIAEDEPVLNVTEVSTGTGKIDLILTLTDNDLLEGRRYQAVRLPEGVSTNIFNVYVAKPDGSPRNPDTYALAFTGNILSVGSLSKAWWGDADGNGVWNTESSNLVWNGGEAFFREQDGVVFNARSGKNPAVTVSGTVTPGNIGVSTGTSVYTFHSGTGACISLPGTLRAIGGEALFNVPIRTTERSRIEVVGRAKLTLGGPFGDEVEAGAVEGLYTKPISMSGGILTVAPGEGKVQTLKERFMTTGDSRVSISNGTVGVWYGGTTGTFGSTKIQIDQGGILNFERLDISGYQIQNNPIVINKGGKLHIKKRDSLSRGLTFNGGKLVLSGKQIDCAVMPSGTFTVHSNSEILGASGGYDWDAGVEGSVDDPVLWIHPNASLTFSIDAGARLANAVTYGGGGTLVQQGSGTFVQNGMPRRDDPSTTYPLTCTGNVKIHPGSTYELNCEHRNGNGEYAVYSGSCLCGKGRITGGRVVIGGMANGQEGGNAKLCGSLTVHALAFRQVPDGQLPMKLGEPWSPVSAKVTGTLSVQGQGETKILINNGSFTVGSECDATGFASARLQLTESGVLAVEAGGSLALEETPVFAEGSTLRIGLDYPDDTPRVGKLRFNSSVDLTGVAFEIDAGDKRVKHLRYSLLTAPSITGVENVLDEKLPTGCKWTYSIKDNPDSTKTLYVEARPGFLLILQ